MEKENKKTLEKRMKTVKLTVAAALVLFASGAILTGYIYGGYVYEEGAKLINIFKSGNPTVNNNVNRGVNYDKLRTFVETASIYNPSFDSLITELSRETFGLSEKQKVTLAYQAVVGKLVKVTEGTLPEKYIDEKDYFLGDGVKGVYELDFMDFNEQYAYFFGTSISYDKLSEFTYGSSDAVGCPVIYKVDKELGKIYFSNYCSDGIVTDKYLTRIYDYDYDDGFYYVYEYVAKYGDVDGYYRASNYEEVDVDDFVGNEKIFDTLVWKFDKDYNFVSTTYK